MYLLVIKPGVLFGECDESLAVREFRCSGCQQVDVIGHEAVRNKRKALLGPGSQELLQHEIDNRLRREQRFSLYRAETKRVTLEAAVIEMGQTFRMSRKHIQVLLQTVRRGPAKAGRHVLKVRLKPDATYGKGADYNEMR